MADGEDGVTGDVIAEGEWAGWRRCAFRDSFEQLIGPFYVRREADGGVVCAFTAEARHMNGGGSMHGGCIMSLADTSLFVIGHDALKGQPGVTVSFNGDFVGPVLVGARVEARGEVVRDGGSLMFVRGLVTADGKPALNYSGVVKKLRPR